MLNVCLCCVVFLLQRYIALEDSQDGEKKDLQSRLVTSESHARQLELKTKNYADQSKSPASLTGLGHAVTIFVHLACLSPVELNPVPSPQQSSRGKRNCEYTNCLVSSSSKAGVSDASPWNLARFQMQPWRLWLKAASIPEHCCQTTWNVHQGAITGRKQLVSDSFYFTFLMTAWLLRQWLLSYDWFLYKQCLSVAICVPLLKQKIVQVEPPK